MPIAGGRQGKRLYRHEVPHRPCQRSAGKRDAVEHVVEENYFFRLSRYEDRLLQHYTDHPEAVQPAGKRNEVLGLITASETYNLKNSDMSVEENLELDFSFGVKGLARFRANIFNQRGEREKAFDAKRLARIGGIWTVTALTMTNDRERTRTELDTATIQYNVGLTNEDFTRRRLEEPAS